MSGEEDKDQKTEMPTQRKLEKAHEQGDVAKSPEVASFMVLGAATLAASFWMSDAARLLTSRLRGFFGNLHQIDMNVSSIKTVGWFTFNSIFGAVLVPLFMIMVAGVIGNVVQHKPVWSAQSLTPKLSRLSPMEGVKRMLGGQAFANYGKGLIKVAIVGCVMFFVLWPSRGYFEGMVASDLAGTLGRTSAIVIKLFFTVLALYGIITIADVFMQRHFWIKRQMMTRQEMKEEFKESEGSPEIKQKIAQIRRQRAQNRMMSKVPKASVVIMNPTHYAVALDYQPGMDAPICVAKGMDELALRIKSVALENNVAVIENPPLARALHASVKLDEPIPEEHYKAVAQVIGYVLGLKRRRA
jgi:flagellar biosynthesis protein FlhB